MSCGVQFATRTTSKVILLTTTLSKILQRPPAHQMKKLHRYVDMVGLFVFGPVLEDFCLLFGKISTEVEIFNFFKIISKRIQSFLL